MKGLRKKMVREMQYRNYSPHTIVTYTNMLGKLSLYYNESPADLRIDQIKDYLHYCITEKQVSLSFISQTISALKILYQDVLGRPKEIITIHYPRREKKLPVILSKQEVKRLLDSTSNIKHKCILMLGYSSGLRISEVVGLQVKDIDSSRMQIRVRGGKGKKDRYTLLSHNVLEILRDYYKQYHPVKYLFNGLKNKGYIGQYSIRSIQKITTASVKKSGINKKVSFHSLRHSFATHLLEQGTNIHVIRKLLGHSNIKTTCIYLHVQQYTLDQVISPLDYKQSSANE